MNFADISAKTSISVQFSNNDKTLILNALETAYNGSPRFRTLTGFWISSGKTINISFLPGTFGVLGLNSGEIFSNPYNLDRRLRYTTYKNN